MSSYSSVHDHQSMVLDDLRNSFYSDAIKNAVNERSIVLDLGAGLGLHGFIAALNGAGKTYLIEPSPVIKIAEKVAKANGLSDKVTCIQKEIQETVLPEKVDIIISVFTGNFLLTEDLLPSLFYARDKYLRPGGILIPDRAIMEVVPVSVPEYYAKKITAWSRPFHSIDFFEVNQYAVNNLYFDGPETMKPTFLAEPAKLMNMNFLTATEAACRNQIEVKIKKNSLCHGWLGWFQVHLGNKWLSTSPLKTQTHWRQVFLPLNEPVKVKTGDKMSFELNRPEFGEWTWSTETANIRLKQSTFLSEPLYPEVLQKKHDNYIAASLNIKGQASQYVLERLNGKESTSSIVKGVAKSYPLLFPDHKHAKRFVIKLIEKFC